MCLCSPNWTINRHRMNTIIGQYTSQLNNPKTFPNLSHRLIKFRHQIPTLIAYTSSPRITNGLGTRQCRSSQAVRIALPNNLFPRKHFKKVTKFEKLTHGSSGLLSDEFVFERSIGRQDDICHPIRIVSWRQCNLATQKFKRSVNTAQTWIRHTAESGAHDPSSGMLPTRKIFYYKIQRSI